MQQQVIEECVALYDAKVGYNENVKNKIGPYIVQKMDMYPLSLVKSIVHKECTAELGRLKTGVDRDRIASLVRGILEKLEDKPRICTENKNNLPVCTDIDGMNESILANMPIDSAAKIVKAAAFSGRILIEGMLRKRGQHVNLWRPRYFKIRSTSVNVAGDGNSSNAIGPYVLCYYRKKDDLEPRDWFVLGPGCVVDEVRESPSKIESKRLFTFRLSFACSGNEDVVDADTPNSAIDILTQTPDGPRSRKLSQSEREALTSSKKRHQRRAKVAASAAMATTAVLLTGGIAGAGLIASTAMASAAGISAARVNSMLQSNHGSTVSLAAESKENAEWWRKNIVDCIAEADAKWNELLAKQDVALNLPPAVIEKSRLRPRAGSIGLVPKALSKSLKNSIHLIADNSWTCYDCLDEITVYQERRLGVATPSMKTSMTIQASADAVFELLMDLNSSYYTTNSVLKAAEVVTTVDHHSDIIYYQLHSCFLWPFHTKPRDMCMLRYWRLEENGCYAICFQSATHPECPENSKYTRANVLGGCYIIAPSIKDVLLGKSGLTSCRVTLVCQIDPAGWIASPLGDKCYMKQAFAVKYLQQIASIRAVLVHEQFETIKPYSNDLEPQTSPLASSLHQILEDFQAMHGTRNLQIAESGQCGFEKLSDDLKEKVSAFNSMRKPQQTFEPPIGTFYLRGPNFLDTGEVIQSGNSLFTYIGLDTFIAKKDGPSARNIGSLPGTAAQKFMASSTELKNHLLILNFMIPGPPSYNLVLYFIANATIGEQGLKYQALYDSFFNVNDDIYRNNKLKLLPSVVEGCWMIRQGIGIAPALLGQKIELQYVRTPQYFEIDCDLQSSFVANGIIRLLLGQCEDLVIDIALVIEGQTQDELPEKLLAAARLDKIKLNDAMYL